MAFTTLISTEALAAHLADPAFLVVDCRFRLDDVGWGERQYFERHIPGAVYASLDRDLSGPKTGTNGRHPLPDPTELAGMFGRLGISDGIQVVAYDQDSSMYAARLWWMLRWLGHDSVAVLDGGFARWIAEGRPTTGGAEQHPPRQFTGAARADMTAGVVDVAAYVAHAAHGAHSGREGGRLIDARSPERYRGESETLDKAAGHIPGAVNHFFQWNLDDRGSFRNGGELRARFEETLGGVPADRAICYCGSGVTACHNLLTMEHAGLTGAKLYAGSWSEWSSDPSRPTETSR